jgi:hypothetical protein
VKEGKRKKRGRENKSWLMFVFIIFFFNSSLFLPSTTVDEKVVARNVPRGSIIIVYTA